MIDTPDGHLYSNLIKKIGVSVLTEVKMYLLDKRVINNVIIDDELIYYFEIPPSIFKSRHMGDDNIPEKSIFKYFNFKEEEIELIEFIKEIDDKAWRSYDKVVFFDNWDSLQEINEKKVLFKK